MKKEEKRKSRYDEVRERFEKFLKTIAKINAENEDDPLIKEFWERASQ